MITPIAVYFEKFRSPNWNGVSPRMADNHILIMLTDGECTYTIDGHDYHLQRGDALYVPEGVMRSARDGPPQWYAAHFRLAGDEDAVIPLLQDLQPRHVHLFNRDYFKSRFSHLTQHWLRKPAYYETIFHCVLLEMLTIVNGEADSRKVHSKAQDVVLQIQDYIQKHYRSDIPITALTELVQRTPNYLSTLFRQVTGQTITEYTQRIRISEACNMLVHTHMSIGEISDHLGFCEQSYFNKVFKKVMGVSPSAYLKERPKVWRE